MLLYSLYDEPETLLTHADRHGQGANIKSMKIQPFLRIAKYFALKFSSYITNVTQEKVLSVDYFPQNITLSYYISCKY